MNNRFVVDEIGPILQAQKPPATLLYWNRLEGVPRADDFSRSLKAEVRDPLWLLTRQWQLGEFLGDDAGSPVTAKVAWTTEPVTHLRDSTGARRVATDDLPLEALTEARPVPETRAGRSHNSALRLALGTQWARLLEHAGLGALVPDFATKDAYQFNAPYRTEATDYDVTAHAAPWQMLAALEGRAVDGLALLAHLATGNLASEGMDYSEPEKSVVDALGEQFKEWAAKRYLAPEETFQTWLPRFLEYRVELSVPDGTSSAAIGAPDYRGGRLDWYNFDAVPPKAGDAPGADPDLQITSFMPTVATFDGMPDTRHWRFEEGAVNLGAIRPDTTDLAHLIFMEFGLVFSNDWFLVPIDLPLGTLTRICGLAVTNTFGERLWVRPAVDPGGPVDGWQMFRLTNRGRPDDRLFLPATVPPTLESKPVESVALVRDEIANMVWGIETTVQLIDGMTYPGREVAQELHRRHTKAHTGGSVASTTDAGIAYRLMQTPGEHWIPFVPVHVPGDNREIQLQRAALPRLLEGMSGKPKKIEPRTELLREGLKTSPTQTDKAYFIAEEEVERTGRVVETRWQRCRSSDGRVILWLSQRVRSGRGEAQSGLAFDLAVPIPPAAST